VTVSIQAGGDLPPVRLCQALFEDAMRRLLDNAIKFSNGNKDAHVAVSTGSADGWVEIAVRDNGVGIPAEQISHLFERFQQIDRDKMEQQGVGLGLAVAQGLIQLHGGEITAQSEPGTGSTFTIRLPAAEE
jgi:two-component system sensor histidine kinase SenX3